MSQFAIEVNGVSKIFGSNTAVNNINLKIGEGEFFSFLGPSGCGKTTLLRMIAGFEKPSLGQIIIAGQDMANVPPHKRHVNMVFQNYALFPHLTVLDNVCFGLRSKGNLNKPEMEARAKEALNLVRLAHLSERYPSQLSGGQQQRVALARAVVNRPKVLLLDEPLSALDPQIRDEMQHELAQLQRELNMTFIMVTHDQSEALALSNRIAVFCLGNLEQVDTPLSIYEEPKTAFVAKFIGNTNLMPGTFVEKQGEFARVETKGGALSLRVRFNRDCLDIAPGAEVVIWVKPQSIDIEAATADAAASQDNRLDAVVLNRSYQGTTTEYLLRVLDSFDLHAYREAGAATAQFGIGEKVSLLLPCGKCSFLPSQSAAVAGGDSVQTAGETEAAKTAVQAAK